MSSSPPRVTQAIDAGTFARSLPEGIAHGRMHPYYVENGDLRRNVVRAGRTVVPQMMRQGDRATWVATGFRGMQGLPSTRKMISEKAAEKFVADALGPAARPVPQATQASHQPVLRDRGVAPLDDTASGPRQGGMSTDLGAATGENIGNQPEEGKASHALRSVGRGEVGARARANETVGPGPVSAAQATPKGSGALRPAAEARSTVSATASGGNDTLSYARREPDTRRFGIPPEAG